MKPAVRRASAVILHAARRLALSLLLVAWLLHALLWLRSYFAADAREHPTSRIVAGRLTSDFYLFRSHAGWIEFLHDHYHFTTNSSDTFSSEAFWRSTAQPVKPLNYNSDQWPFEIGWVWNQRQVKPDQNDYGTSLTRFVLPHWIISLALLLGILTLWFPFWWLRRRTPPPSRPQRIPFLRRMASASFTGAALVSILLFLAVSVLSIHSFFRTDIFQPSWVNDHGTRGSITILNFTLSRAGLHFSHARLDSARSLEPATPPDDFYLTFRSDTQSSSSYPSLSHLGIPSWAGFSFYSAAPASPVSLPFFSTFTPDTATELIFPFPLLLPLFALLPWLYWRSKLYPVVLFRRRRARGLCVHCGYNLQAHPVSARCPECGTTVPN